MSLPPPPGGTAPPQEPEPGSITPPEPKRGTAGIWAALAGLVLAIVVVAVALQWGDDAPVPTTPSPGVGSTTTVDAPIVAEPGEATIDAEPSMDPLPEGRPIPEWSGPSLDGGTIVWSERPAGPTVLAIWAPWCPHCQAELPRLSGAVAGHPAIGLVTIATATTQAAEPTPQGYMESEGLEFPVALDDVAGTLAQGLGVVGFPTTYFVDSDGLVVLVAEGELDPDGLEDVLSYLETT